VYIRCGASCTNVLQCVAVHCTVCCSASMCCAVCCSLLHCVAQCVSVRTGRQASPVAIIVQCVAVRLPCFAQHLAIAFRDSDAYGAHTSTPLYGRGVSSHIWITLVFFPRVHHRMKSSLFLETRISINLCFKNNSRNCDVPF